MNEKTLTKPYIVLVLALLACLFWGSAFPAIKIGYKLFNISQDDTYSKIIFAGYRFLLSALMIFFLIKFNSGSLKFTRHQFKKLLMLGFLQTTINYAFFYIGLSNTSGSKASILMATNTLFSVLLARLFYTKEKLSPRKNLGLALGFLGVVLVNLNTKDFSAGFSLTGEFFILLASLTGAVSSVYTKKASQNIDAFLLTGYQLFIGSIFLILLGFSAGASPLSFDLKNSLLLAYLSLASASAFSIWTLLLKYNPVNKIVIYKFTVPIFGLILSHIFLDENILGLRLILSLILVSSSIILISLKEK